MENQQQEELDPSLQWNHYFPFTVGQDVVAQLSGRKFFLSFTANGRVEVKEITERNLSFELNIPKQTVAGLITVPASLLTVSIAYVQRGPGNSANISGNIGDQPIAIEDEDLSILSYPRTKRRRIDPSLDIEAGDLRFELVSKSQATVEIRDIQGTALPSTSVIKIWSKNLNNAAS